MILLYDDIKINDKLYFEKGKLELPDVGLVIISGENGVGKSLLCQNIFCCNKYLNIVYVDQTNDSIISSRSVLENISMQSDKNYNEKIKNDLYNKKLDYLLDLDIKKMSGGEKRIVSFLRGYYSNSSIIILDEPSNDLDFKMVDILKGLISDLQTKKLVLMISHDNRLISLSDKVIELQPNIINNKFQFKSGNSIITKKYDKNERFLRKSFHYNFLSMIVVFLLLLVSFLKMIEFKIDNENVSTKTINDLQVEIYAPGARSLGSYLFNECLPQKTLKIMNQNIFSQLSMYKDISVDDKHHLNQIKNIDDCTIYPFEYYDKDEKAAIFVLDYYCQKMYGASASDFSIDTSLLFDNPYLFSYESDRSICIDKEYYFMCVDEINSLIDGGKRIELVASILVFESKINYDALSSIDSISGTYIRSNDIKELKYNLSLVDSLFDGTGIILLFTLLTILINSFLTYIIIKNENSKIRVFKNYNYDKNIVLYIINLKHNCRFVILIPYLIFIMSNIILYANSSFALINYYYSFLLFFLIPLFYYASNIIIKTMIDKRFRWDYR